MTLSASDFHTEDISDFAEFLGLNGIDGDLFYESYYQIDVDDEIGWEWEDEVVPHNGHYTFGEGI